MKMRVSVTQPSRFFPGAAPKGYKRTFFFPKIPIVDQFVVSDPIQITGYINFRYLTSGSSTPCGVLFESIKQRTSVQSYLLKVGFKDDLPDLYTPVYTLEKLGILLFKANDSSILAVPVELNSSLLVRAE